MFFTISYFRRKKKSFLFIIFPLPIQNSYNKALLIFILFYNIPSFVIPKTCTKKGDIPTGISPSHIPIYFVTTDKINTDTIKTTANIFDHVANLSSIPFITKKVSAPPVIAPDKPALFPDCSKTVAIKPIAEITTIIVIRIFTENPPSPISTQCTYSSRYREKLQ